MFLKKTEKQKEKKKEKNLLTVAQNTPFPREF